MSNQYAPAILFTNIRSVYLWVPLLFSGFYFFPFSMIWKTLSVGEICLVFVAYILFVIGYIEAQKADVKRVDRYTLALTVLALLTTSINPGTCALYPFIAFIVGFYRPFSAGLSRLLVILVAIAVSAWLFDLVELYYLLPAYLATLPNYFFGSIERQKQHHEYEKKQSQKQNEQLATIAERERIARDLHDLLGHTLSCIALKAELATKLGKAGEVDRALVEIAEVADITRSTLSEVREAVSGYKSKDMKAELAVIKKRLQDHGLDVDCTFEPTKLTPKAESSIILILKEAATNILKHSNGNTASLLLVKDSDALRLTVENNGRMGGYQAGNGITGIRDRVEELGGTMDISVDKFFRLDMRFPKGVFLS